MRNLLLGLSSREELGISRRLFRLLLWRDQLRSLDGLKTCDSLGVSKFSFTAVSGGLLGIKYSRDITPKKWEMATARITYQWPIVAIVDVQIRELDMPPRMENPSMNW